jgi:phenylalanyl-tRNA synthetase beta chain
VKVLLSWLRDFVDVPGTAQEIAATMSVRGFAVEGIDAVGSEDAVIDFEVTANRPDCLSVVGIAREVATAYGLQLRRPALRERTPDRSLTPPEAARGPDLHLASLKAVDAADVDIAIDAPVLCPRYVGAVADVTIGSSPEWMQARLRSGGVRPISNIVDVTNYVLLELGQPMHAFDHARLADGRIVVRTARPGERITTLDDEERALTPDMLVIADADAPIAIAGVKGGASSEVTSSTTTIVLESAYFNPLSVRRTSKALGLKTDASTRFERGSDPRLPVTAMERACALLELIGAGVPRGTVVDRYPKRVEPTVLRLRRSAVPGLLGIDVPEADLRRILESLGFALREAGDGWDVTVPTRRVDVTREVDVIEEVARHYGFHHVPARFPAMAVAPGPVDRRIARARRLRGLMTGAGFSEAVTFGFVSARAARDFALEPELVGITNPLSETFAVLRPSVLPGLVTAAAHNHRREQRDVQLFELGARFSTSGGERQALACVWTGMVGGDHWSGGTRAVDLFDVAGAAERVCTALGVSTTTSVSSVPWLVEGQAAALVSDDGTVALAGRLAADVAERHGFSSTDAVFVAEVDLDAGAIDLRASSDVLRVAPLPKYPSMTRDISIVVSRTTAAAAIRRTIVEAAPSTLVRIREFDRYQGSGVPQGSVSLSLRLMFRAPDRTLTETEVHDAMQRVLGALVEQHHAVQR